MLEQEVTIVIYRLICSTLWVHFKISGANYWMNIDFHHYVRAYGNYISRYIY